MLLFAGYHSEPARLTCASNGASVAANTISTERSDRMLQNTVPTSRLAAGIER